MLGGHTISLKTQELLLQSVVIGFFLLLGVVLSFLLTNGYYTIFAGLVFVFVTLLLLFCQKTIYLLCLIFLVRPFIETGVHTIGNFTLAQIFGMWVFAFGGVIVLQRISRMKKLPFLRLVIFFGVIFLCALVLSLVVNGCSLNGIIEIGKVLSWFLLFYLGLLAVDNPKDIMVIYIVILLGALGLASQFLLNYIIGKVTISQSSYAVSWQMMLSSRQATAVYIAQVIPLVFFLKHFSTSMKRSSNILDIFCYSVLFLLVLTILLSLSRLGIILLFFAVFLITLLRKDKRLLSISGALTLLILAFYKIPFIYDRFSYAFSNPHESTMFSRFDLWKYGLTLLKDSPIFGCGLAAKVDFVAPNRLSHYHNSYLQIAVESGLIGFSCFLIFFFGMIVLLYAYFRKVKDREPQGYIVFLLIAISIIPVAMISENIFGGTSGLWLFWFNIGVFLNLSGRYYAETSKSRPSKV